MPATWIRDCEREFQERARSHANDLERSPSILPKTPTSPEILDHEINVSSQLLSSRPSRPKDNMHRYNSQNNMTYDDSRYFNGTQESTFEVESEAPEAAGRNMMLNFGGTMDRLDPSASFPGLGELPSNGMEPAVEQNLTGTFTGDLNSTAYEVGDDHNHLLQEMLQQHSQTQQAQLSDANSQVPATASHGAWEDSLNVLQEMVHLQQQQQVQQIYNQAQTEAHEFNQSYSADRFRNAPYGSGAKFPGESDLLNLFQFPRSTSTSLIPSFGYTTGIRGKGPWYSTSTISGPVNTDNRSIGVDPLLAHHSQNSSQGFFHNLSRGNTPEASRHGGPATLVDLDQEREVLSGKNIVYGSKRELGAASAKGEPRGVNHFATERQRREYLNEKYQTLRSLVPNPTKADRASIVADAIEYVKELKRTVQELQLLVQEKRRAAGDSSGAKRRRSLDATDTYPGACTPENASNGHLVMQKGNDTFSADGSQLRSSWLQRTSQNGTHVDVRIVHDEVTIKVNQRRGKTCLVFDVISVLQELQLDLLQASGATIGEHDVFLFNTKILEGSSTFAGYIAVKLLDALDRHFVINQ
ncbi:transcription factor EAT1 isoform X2 [Physcomitrium patens]|uniref:transcription factor EAT1 isoform X2 n=1 Tax=Physcomitrium patens TaxID=3218 RepID=UPI000D1788F1|nr:transcription factor EAT1-like isoform X2 [Physcomitrium patens]XP_024375414.1 transcription factor EAT1-like isoform X2 [Physcomitrium patens]|eukprot:XP_024375413.1 transcription factor EAT1-like isoform X2 [Physcomitrella patens]